MWVIHMADETPEQVTQDDHSPPPQVGAPKGDPANPPQPAAGSTGSKVIGGAGSSAPAMPVAARVGFVLFGALFAAFGVMAWVSTSATITNVTPAIVTALLGLVTNWTAGVGPPNKTSTVSWNNVAWRCLIIAGIVSTAACAAAMTVGTHKAAQGAFELVGGGLFGLLIDTSQLSPLQNLLMAVASAWGLKTPSE